MVLECPDGPLCRIPSMYVWRSELKFDVVVPVVLEKEIRRFIVNPVKVYGVDRVV